METEADQTAINQPRRQARSEEIGTRTAAAAASLLELQLPKQAGRKSKAVPKQRVTLPTPRFTREEAATTAAPPTPPRNVQEEPKETPKVTMLITETEILIKEARTLLREAEMGHHRHQGAPPPPLPRRLVRNAG